MDTLIQDLRRSSRVLLAGWRSTLVALVSLTLAIGANAAVFGLINSVLLRDLPYDDPEELVFVWETFPLAGGRGQGTASPPNFADWKSENHVFTAIGAYAYGDFRLMRGGEPVRVSGASLSGELFSLLGVDAAAGRTILPTEDTAGRDRVVVLSHDFWKQSFDADPAIVGKSVKIDGEDYTVVGVMPASFHFPPRSNSALWTPLTLDGAANHDRGDHRLRVVARLRPGTSVTQAQAEMTTIAGRLADVYPESMRGRGVLVEPLSEVVIGGLRRTLLIFFGAALLVLLIGCANVANLLLARATARRKEFSVRAALGASPARLVRLVLTESLLLSLLGGALGLAFGKWLAVVLSSFAGLGLNAGQGIDLDVGVIAFCIVVSIAAAVLSGLVPALRSAKANLQETLKDRGSTQRGGEKARSTLGALVVAEIAFATIVLIGAGLMLRSFLLLEHVETGLQAESLLTLRVPLAADGYSDPGTAERFYERLLERVRAIPGVESAGVISMLPIQVWGYNGDFFIRGRDSAASEEKPFTELRVVSPGYFTTAGVPLLAGRLLEERDRPGAAKVVLVNQSLARRYWPGEDPLGKEIAFDVFPATSAEWLRIVGVVGDVKSAGLSRPVANEIYVPLGQHSWREMSLVARTQGDPASVVPAIRGAVRSLDTQQPIFLVKTMDQVVSDSLAGWRSNTLLLGLLAALALSLALGGVYGVVSYSVAQRVPEMGLRLALGAPRTTVVALIARQGLILAAAGAGLGVLVSFLLTRAMTGELYGVAATDPASIVTATLLVLAVVAVACLLPARRASRTDPMIALRDE